MSIIDDAIVESYYDLGEKFARETYSGETPYWFENLESQGYEIAAQACIDGQIAISLVDDCAIGWAQGFEFVARSVRAQYLAICNR